MIMVLHSRSENYLDVLHFSTHLAITEQLLVESSLNLYLSQYDSLPIHSAKKEFCDNAYVEPMNPHAICVFEPNICVESRHVVHIASDKDELKLLSSLKTLVYIEFDVLCNLIDLEKQLFEHAELPWCSRHTYHSTSKYDNNGKHLIHRIYIFANLNFPFVMQDCNQLNGSNITDIHMPSSPMLAFVSTNLLQDRIENDFLIQDHVHSDQGACRISFEYNWRRG